MDQKPRPAFYDLLSDTEFQKVLLWKDSKSFHSFNDDINGYLQEAQVTTLEAIETGRYKTQKIQGTGKYKRFQMESLNEVTFTGNINFTLKSLRLEVTLL